MLHCRKINLNLNINFSGIEPLLNGAIALVGEKRENSKLTKKEFKLYSSFKDVEKLKRVYNTGFIVQANFNNNFEIKRTVQVNDLGISAIDFGINSDLSNKLYKKGYDATNNFLNGIS
jgi:hypothetical protein